MFYMAFIFTFGFGHLYVHEEELFTLLSAHVVSLHVLLFRVTFYSRTSMARTLMAGLPRLFRTTMVYCVFSLELPR